MEGKKQWKPPYAANYMCNILHTNEMGLENNMHAFQTSSLDSFQSSFTSISLKESCDLCPFLISMSSMSKMSVLLGGILPVGRTDQVSENPIAAERNTSWGFVASGHLLQVLSEWYLSLLCHRPELEGWSASCVPLCTYPADLYPSLAAPLASQEWTTVDFCPHLYGCKESQRSINQRFL